MFTGCMTGAAPAAVFIPAAALKILMKPGLARQTGDCRIDLDL